ncbi:hypothetical protein JYK14_24440 [Siccirubricoccus sp. KC 17139]|uniref:Uncharacterized protein n=1 Tax=Siccirubricoccus soli TaxID=2899147 RepID=A0ABT1DBL1_9PROT|nr:hypothetical protein [Siccirubricoccus soli]MCO6419284.1 hypothetical protein [Siccirubricoccus soli]MCP2685419.1 hypothetical protein [Siccirubricoccus soli]
MALRFDDRVLVTTKAGSGDANCVISCLGRTSRRSFPGPGATDEARSLGFAEYARMCLDPEVLGQLTVDELHQHIEVCERPPTSQSDAAIRQAKVIHGRVGRGRAE